MIRFTLRCTAGHEFDSWFASGAAFDRLEQAGHLSCAVCGRAEVAKALMAPAVRSAAEPVPPAPPAPTGAAPLSDAAIARAEPPAPEILRARIEALRREIEAKADYVGDSFVTEVRAIHQGEAPERAIWGEARPDEARALHDEGVPITPLPFVPRQKTN